MARVVHRVQELILVGEVAQDEVDQAEGQNQDSVLEYAINNTYYVNQDWLRKEEAILEYGWLLEFVVVCKNSVKAPKILASCVLGVPRGVFAPNLVIGYNVTEPTCRSLNGNIPSP